MDIKEFQRLWSETLRSAAPDAKQFDRLAEGVVDLYASGNAQFRQHIKNRFNRVTESTGQNFDAENFDLAMARAFIADEAGFTGWDQLIDAVKDGGVDGQPLLFRYAVAALWRGDFTSLENTVGGADAVDDRIIAWYEAGYFADEPETLAESFAAACWLGLARTAAYLLDKGVDPYAGMRTGLSGFHWAASSGRLNVIKLLTGRGIPLEVKSMYDGTVLGQALWSAIYEYTDDHAEIIGTLIEAGAEIEPGTLKWWSEQPVPSPQTKQRVAEALRKAEEK